MGDEGQRGAPQAQQPQAPTASGNPDLLAADNAGPALPAARILILEDESWDADLAQRLLTGAGLSFNAIVVDTRESFAAQLTAFIPDVIISDFTLPGFSGREALQMVQGQCPDIPVIIWSGVLGDEAAVELIKEGAADYVLKDRPARLPSAVERALTQARQRARLAQIEGQLGRAHQLASLGHLRAAEQAMGLTRQLLATARDEVTTANPPP